MNAINPVLPCYARRMPDGTLEGRNALDKTWRPLITDQLVSRRLLGAFKDSPATVKKLTAMQSLNGDWEILITDTEELI